LRQKILFLLPFLLVSLSGCGNIFYLSKLGWHQARVSLGSVPVQEVMEDDRREAQSKEKIRFIQEVKSFGEERLHLKKTKNYSTFFDVEGPILYAVTASEKDRLKLHSWSFPIAGRVTYRSFFSRKDALKEQKSLEEEGYDTFVQGVGAYSTLGWMKDPIFSSMLNWSEAALANVILHEMTHATIYFKGKTDMNEQLASFVGNRGAIDFLTEKYGPGSKEVLEAVSTQHDDLLFSGWIDKVSERLSSFYGQPISRDEKLKGREAVFQSIRGEFEEVSVRLKADCYRGFDRQPLNNAVILAYRRYIHGLEKFEALYDRLGRDLKKVIEFLKEIQEKGEDPASFLTRAAGDRQASP
jgi:predicted aminopeptidase